MSTAGSFPGAHSADADKLTGRPLERIDAPCDVAAPKRFIRRRPDPYQGRALEKLGHAVEYLVDSRMALIDKPATSADAEAVDILMRLSRLVFSECKEIVPVGRRLKAWLSGCVARRVH